MEQTVAPKHSYGCSLHFGDEARKALTERAEYIAKIVGRTMGPHGSPVLLDREGKVPSLSKDGTTVLYDIEKYDLVQNNDDHMYNIVYEIMRASSEDVSKNTGDGTSAVVWLIWQFMRGLNKCFNAELDQKKVLEGFNYAVDYMLNGVWRDVLVADDERTINAALHTAANGDEEIIDTLTDVFLDVGDEGMIFLRDSQTVHTKVFYEEGMDLPMRLDTPELLNEHTLKLELKNPYVLVCMDKITSPWQLVPILEDIANAGDTQDLVVVYSEMDESVKSLFHKNNYSKDVKLRVASFRMPMYTDRQQDFLEDFAAITNATTISKKLGHDIRKCGLEELGRAETIVLRSTLCSVINGLGSKTKTDDGSTVLQTRIDAISKERDAFTGNIEERNRYNERLAKMTGAVVSICPGAHSRAEIVRKKGAYEDSIRAGQCAIKSGIVAGAGWPWYLLAQEIEDCLVSHADYEYVAGVKAATKAFRSVFEKLCEDAGSSALECYMKIQEWLETEANHGTDECHACIDLHTMKVGHCVDVRVVDPIILHDDIISQARSIAVTLMNTNCVITTEPTEEFKKFKEVQRFSHLRV